MSRTTDTSTSASLGLETFNDEPAESLRPRLLACLGVDRWADDVLDGRPYAGRDEVFEVADRSARPLDEAELAAALAGHPRHGERDEAGDPRTGRDASVPG